MVHPSHHLEVLSKILQRFFSQLLLVAHGSFPLMELRSSNKSLLSGVWDLTQTCQEILNYLIKPPRVIRP